MRTYSASLQAHLDTRATTLCFLLKITPRIETGVSAFGVTSLDQDILYDDGGGALNYSAIIGVNTTAFQAASDLSVDNTEAMILISTTLSKEDINAGVLDYASFHVYRICWDDTSKGHYLVQSGTTGQVRSTDNLSGVIELRGIAQQLKQNFSDLYSIGCRARFGSQVGEEQFPCTYDFSSLWSNKTVATVDADDPDMVFTINTAPTAAAGTFDAAIIEFLTGNNTGLTVETELVDGVNITLRFNSAYAIEVGDTLKIRPDCQKRYAEDCVGQFNNGLFFRGEPYIPITEDVTAHALGANVAGLGGQKVNHELP
jgi:uncharacterized phage protein (TIGR02218 family)